MRPLARYVAVFTALALALLLSGCSTYRDHLNRGQRLYDENEYEHALALWRSLEPDMDSLSFNDQARYAYLRGMTDFRLGFRPDARHWLAVAKAIEQDHPGGLSAEWKARTEESLNDLNKEVYGGAEALDSESTAVEHTRAPKDDESGSNGEPSPSP